MCIYPPAFLPIPSFCSHYIKILANSQTFLDTTAGYVWIVLFLSFLDYIYLAISCVMAGGRDAVFHAQEALEDHGEIARMALEKWGLRPADTVVAASASGRTPYCVSDLDLSLIHIFGCFMRAQRLNSTPRGSPCTPAR